jgi:hypothetical protein
MFNLCKKKDHPQNKTIPEGLKKVLIPVRALAHHAYAFGDLSRILQCGTGSINDQKVIFF